MTEQPIAGPACQVGGPIPGETGMLSFGAPDGSNMFDKDRPCGQPSVARVGLFVGKMIYVEMCQRHVTMARRVMEEQKGQP